MSQPVEIWDKMSAEQSDEDGEHDCEMEGEATNLSELSTSKKKVLSAEEVYEMMEAEISKVCDVSELSRTKARSLLNHFKCDTEKLLEHCYAEDPGTLELIRGNWETVRCDPEMESTCLICLKTIEDQDLKIFSCNHRVCSACFAEYIRNIVASEGGLVGASIKCPGNDCDFEIDDDLVHDCLLSQDPALVFKYQKIIINNFVQNHRNLKWCPSAGCNNAVHLGAGETSNLLRSVRCDCGHWFCFHCLKNSHDPVDCKMLEKWIKTDLDTSKWISLNTKPCPGCGINIERFGGEFSYLINCSKCNQKFCWKCLWNPREDASWEMHLKCPEKQSSPLQENEDPRISYASMELMYEYDLTYYNNKIHKTALDHNFISNAFEVLLQCRRALMHSYIFFHFTDTADNQMHIFENNLKYLEQLTKSLAEILHKVSTADTVAALEITIIDSVNLCNSHRTKLTDHIKEGQEMGWWHRNPFSPDDADV